MKFIKKDPKQALKLSLCEAGKTYRSIRNPGYTYLVVSYITLDRDQGQYHQKNTAIVLDTGKQTDVDPDAHIFIEVSSTLTIEGDA